MVLYLLKQNKVNTLFTAVYSFEIFTHNNHLKTIEDALSHYSSLAYLVPPHELVSI